VTAGQPRETPIIELIGGAAGETVCAGESCLVAEPEGLEHNARMPTNFENAFAPRPEVYAGWVQLNTALEAGMDLAERVVDDALVVGRPIADA